MNGDQAKPSQVPYLIAVVLMVAIVVGAIVAVMFLRPTADNSSIVTEIIGFASTVTMALFAFLKAQETHVVVNSQMDSFKSEVRQAAAQSGLIAHAEGVVQGRAEADARTDALAQPLAKAVVDALVDKKSS
jgi:hypothetical protein